MFTFMIPACATHWHMCKRWHISLHKRWFLLSNAIKTSPLFSTHQHTLTHFVDLNSLGDMTQLDGSTCFSSQAICSSTRQTCSTTSDCTSLCLQLSTSVHYCLTKQFSNYNYAWITADCIARSSNPAFHSLSHLYYPAVVDSSLHTAADQLV